MTGDIPAPRTGRRLAASLWVLRALLLLAPVSALAGSFQINPTRLILSPTQSITSLTLRNAGKEPVAVRVLTYRWTQEKGIDVYTPTDDLIASPPIFTTPAGATQLIRVGLRRRLPNAAYRVILEEIPRPSTNTVIQVALRLNLPMYVETVAGGGKPAVRWTAWRDATGEIVLEGRNDGTAYAQITAIGLTGADGRHTDLTSSMGVVLPDSMRLWRIGKHPELRSGSDLPLIVRSASGDESIMARLETR